MPQEIVTTLETLKRLKQRSEDRAEQLMEEIVELEEYAKRLDPIIDLVEKMPELGDDILSSLQPPPERRTSKPRGTIKALAAREKIYAILREKQLTITEISAESGLSSGYTSEIVKGDVERGVLEKYERFDKRIALRIVSEEIRNPKQAVPGSQA